MKSFVSPFGLYQIDIYHGDKAGAGSKEMWCCNKKFIWLCIMSAPNVAASKHEITLWRDAAIPDD
ncbi:hypothetical protein EJ896_04080 [Klebsiella quasipneumoniae subsp. similipneumoniae]|nr:hypothetical protein EJ896_04080 [Klebsiella quasipneumoniae subsp. similipneumoniae]